MKYIVTLLLLAGCAGKPLTPEEKQVRLLRKSDAPAGCKEIQKVQSKTGMFSPMEEDRENDLRRETYKIGGNTVTFDREQETTHIYLGTAFNCPN